MISNLIAFIVFPGALFAVVLSVILVWMVRKFAARMENRVGPPFLQPLYDFSKLLAKERVYPGESQKYLLRFLPIFQFFIALTMSFFLPVLTPEGLISFEGDVYFFIFLLGIHGSSAFFIGWLSNNPYGYSGSGRAVMIELSLEIPLSLSIAGMAVISRSMRISTMTEYAAIHLFAFESLGSSLLLIPWLILLVVSLISTLGALEYNPFSAGHAETEIVAGWMTELTGPDLALVKLAEFLNLMNLSGLIAAIFLGGPPVFDLGASTWIVSFLGFIVKVMVVVFLLAFLKTVSGRMRVDQTTEGMWKYLLPISAGGIILILLILQYGGV